MSVKLRLQRHGKKGKPFYWIVAADARSKRDGKFLDKLGIYNPNTNPATIELDVDALTEEEAEKKFQAWLDEKASKVDAKKDGLAKADAEAKAKALEAEKAANEARIAAASPVVEEEVTEEVSEEATNEVAEEATAEAPAEEVKATNEEE